MKTDNKFNPSQLRLSQNFSESTGVKKHYNTIPVRKPGRQDFIRTHPDSKYRLETAIIELKEERETYLVDPSLWNELPGELIPKVLITYINRQNVLSLWPIRLPGSDGRIDHWNNSALEAAVLAETSWVRVSANMHLGAYEVFTATGDLLEPEWPDLSFEEILKIAFKGRYIDSLDHSVIRRLVGGA
ncbi:MAG: hypothetical protein VW874_04875 [Gammaproteobacteria bacterium]